MSSAYPHITLDPAVCGGRACVEATGIRVTEVAAAAEGRSMPDLQEFFHARAALSLGELYAALGYYEDHKPELLVALAEDKRVSDVAERERLDKIKRFYLGQ